VFLRVKQFVISNNVLINYGIGLEVFEAMPILLPMEQTKCVDVSQHN
jgi:hypothetical protein